MPRPTVDEHACSRRLGSGCEVCIQACPKQALQVEPVRGRDDHAPSVDAMSCVGCGLCEALCPVEAISDVGIAPELIIERATGQDKVQLRCEVARLRGASFATASSGVDVGCVAGVHPETLTAAAGSGSSGEVELLIGDCMTCPMGAGDAVVETIAEARIAADGQAGIQIAVTAEGSAPSQAANRPAAKRSRRSLFGLRDPSPPEPEAPRPPAQSTITRATPRELLLAHAPSPALPRPSTHTGCTACNACVRICPTSALTLTEDGVGTSVLTVDPTACVGCDECVRVCPEDVMQPSARRPGRDPVRVATITARACVSCGITLSADEADQCNACNSRSSLISDVWRHL